MTGKKSENCEYKIEDKSKGSKVKQEKQQNKSNAANTNNVETPKNTHRAEQATDINLSAEHTFACCESQAGQTKTSAPYPASGSAKKGKNVKVSVLTDLTDNGAKVLEGNNEGNTATVLEYAQMLQRLQADFENYKKRIEKEKKDFAQYISAELVAKLLPVLDSFELALKNKGADEDFVKGIELIYSQFFGMLQKTGLQKIDALGKRFNPEQHEALLAAEDIKADGNIILEELQKGYMFNGIVIRTAKVKVSKPKDE